MKIEFGKHYRYRSGGYAGQAAENPRHPNSSPYPFLVGHYTHMADGRYSAGEFNHKLDLVAECDGPPDFSEPAGPILLNWSATASTEYAPLAAILQEAYDQAATGKGKERHANDRPFIDQPILEIGRMCGPGFDTGQSIKKQQEAMGMLARGDASAAIRELLGAINYTAAAVLLIREQNPGA